MWKYLLEKEFKQFFRDPGLPKMALVFPVLMMLVFPFAVSMDIRNINLAVVDNCMSTGSARFMEKCTSSGYFRLVDLCHDPDEAMALMDANKVDAVITIMPDFDRQIGTGKGFPAGIKVNTVNGTKGSLGAQYILQCVRLYLSENGTGMQAAAAGVAGVKTVVVNFMTQKMIVEFDEGADPKAVMTEVRRACQRVEPDCEVRF